MPAKVEPVAMDSRKFLGTLNNSAQSKVAVFESLVRKMGERTGADWRLAALNDGNLFIEDANGSYYVANHQRLHGGKISITDIRPVKLVEEQKRSIFEQNCRCLVDSVEKNDQRAMRTSFNNLAAQRFSPFTVPPSGLVRTKDGRVRCLRVEGQEKILDPDTKQKLVAALVESFSDSVVLENGQVISATFGADHRQRLPISEWTCRKVVGTRMREAAQQAYLSLGFQKRVYKVAKLIDEDKIAEAVAGVKDFLAEQQEFCLLTRGEMQTLIENALATKAVLCQPLCNDTATLFYRTNLRVNRDSIIREWRATATKAQHPVLLENVSILEKAKDFESAYDKFLDFTFNEAMSPRDEEIKAYRTALGLLRDSPKIQEDQELRTKVEELIDRLSDQDVDDATVYLVRETLASAHKELEAMDTLSNYDTRGDDRAAQEQGEELGEELGDEVGEELGGEGQPAIVINSPLIQIGGTSGGGGAEPAMDDLGDLGGDDLGDEDLGDEGLEDLDLGGEEEDDLGLGDEDEGLGLEDEEDKNVNISLDSQQKKGKKPLTETQRIAKKALGKKVVEDKSWFKDNVLDKKKDKKKDDKKDDKKDEEMGEECDEGADPEVELEGADPYAMGGDVDFASGVGTGYGQPVLKDEMADVLTNLFRIAEEKGLADNQLLEDAQELVVEALKAAGVRVPQHRLNATIEQVISQLTSLSEDQFKWGTLRRRRGMPKSRLAKTEGDKEGSNREISQGKGFEGEAPKTETNTGFSGAAPKSDAAKGFSGNEPKSESKIRQSIVWTEHDEKGQGVKGDLNGVRFILDYASPPVVLSEDGSVDVPVPEELCESALAAAGLQKGDARPFTRWLASGIEQFRPITEQEDRSLEEAVATITATGDGNIEVSVDSGVEVDEGGTCPGCNNPLDGCTCDNIPGTEQGEVAEPGAEGMQPVTDIEPQADAAPEQDGIPGDEMPDFGGEEEEGEEEEEESSEKVVGEDKDVTDPKSKEYDTTTQDHREGPKEKGAQKPSKGKDIEGFGSKSSVGKVDIRGSTRTKLKPAKPGENRI